MPIIKIATRQSTLALWQAEYVRNKILHFFPNLTIELVPMLTKGDKILDVPLSKVGGKGLFIKELEHALLKYNADIAVHSIKDIPMQIPAGLTLETICKRDIPYDAFVSNNFKSIEELPLNAVVGTSSLRRECQLRYQRPDLKIKSLRGNVETRLSKLDNNNYDAIILACAGLKRLKLEHRITKVIPESIIIPAAGQGAVGIEIRANDSNIKKYLAPLDNANSRAQIIAERAMNTHLNGGCQVPLGCFATTNHETLTLNGFIGEPDGSVILKTTQTGSIAHPKEIGIAAAIDLLNQGAAPIIKKWFKSHE